MHIRAFHGAISDAEFSRGFAAEERIQSQTPALGLKTGAAASDGRGTPRAERLLRDRVSQLEADLGIKEAQKEKELMQLHRRLQVSELENAQVKSTISDLQARLAVEEGVSSEILGLLQDAYAKAAGARVDA
eukprot:evm.model.scf_1114.1 EVM.evm.TU.scf_1114.1   scf_1114:25907-27187(-)